MELLPDQVKALWVAGARNSVPPNQLWQEQQRLMDGYRGMWAEGLQLEGHTDLKESLLAEIGEYMHIGDLRAVEERCRHAVDAVKDEWHVTGTSAADRPSVEAFYDQTKAYVFDLMWWHTLLDDPSPLAYVVAMRFGQQQRCCRYLDFGSGVGSAGILFARHGFDVTLADISSNLLQFAAWRLRRRSVEATLLDLKSSKLPEARYDIVTAMDVWEHLVDPVTTVDRLANAIVPGGFLFSRFAAQADSSYPQHIVFDFGPTFERLAARGFVEVWRDEWLWGHQAFQKQ